MIRNASVVIYFVFVYTVVFNCAFIVAALIYAGSALDVSFSVLVCKVTAGAVAQSSALVLALVASDSALYPSALMFVVTAGASAGLALRSAPVCTVITRRTAGLALRSAPVCTVITRRTAGLPVPGFTLSHTVTT